MRNVFHALVVVIPFGAGGCGVGSFLSGRCTTEFVEVSWPVVLQRGAERSSLTLHNRVTTGNVGQDVYERIRAALIEGRSIGPAGVAWDVPAFDTNGGFISLMIPAPLDPGVTAALGPGSGGGWGIVAVSPSSGLAAARTGSGFASLTGTLTALARAPFEASISLAGAEADGRPISVTGDARFRLTREVGPCD